MAELLQSCALASIAIVGFMEWIKHLKIKKLNEKGMPYLSLALSLLGSLAIALHQKNFNILGIFVAFGITLSFVQIGYQSVVRLINNVISKYTDRLDEKVPLKE